jgi:hypothetical protein
MSVSVSVDGPAPVEGIKRRVFADITFDASYPTGGETLDPASFGLSVIEEVIPVDQSEQVVRYDHASGKLVAYGDIGAAEVADLTDLSTISVRVEVVGR